MHEHPFEAAVHGAGAGEASVAADPGFEGDVHLSVNGMAGVFLTAAESRRLASVLTKAARLTDSWERARHDGRGVARAE